MMLGGPTDPGSDTWWEATRSKHLLIQRCGSCRKYQHYPRVVCTHCGARSLSLTEASGGGTVYSFTVVHPASRGSLDQKYTVALVRLSEGPLFLTHIVGDSDVACDMLVTLDWQPLPDGKHLPVFKPTR